MKHSSQGIKWFVTFLILGCAIYWAIRSREQVSAAWQLSPVYLAVLAPLVIVSLLLIGLTNQIAASHLGAPLKFRQWSNLAFASTLANYVLPMRAGAALRAFYYRRHCALPFARFASLMAVVHVVTLLANAVVGILVLAWLWWTRDLLNPVVFGAFLGVAVVCTVALMLPARSLPSFGWKKLSSTLESIREGWELSRTDRHLMIEIFLLSLAVTSLFSLRLYIAFLSIGHDVSLVGCVFIGSLVAISTFISLTPASLGVREGMIILGCLALGVEPEVSLLAGAMDRAVSLLVVIALGSHGLLRINREMHDKRKSTTRP